MPVSNGKSLSAMNLGVEQRCFEWILLAFATLDLLGSEHPFFAFVSWHETSFPIAV